MSRPVELSVSHEGSVTPFHLRVLWYGLVLVPSFCTASWVGGYALRGMASGSDAVSIRNPPSTAPIVHFPMLATPRWSTRPHSCVEPERAPTGMMPVAGLPSETW